MLGNSSRGVTLLQKRLLYRSCVITYGLRLWYFSGARVWGVIRSMEQVQRRAALWISGNFRTSNLGWAESSVGLLPLHLLLRRLVERGCFQAPLLAPSHPLRAVIGTALPGGVPAHPLGLLQGGAFPAVPLKSSSVDSAEVAGVATADVMDPFGSESRPGNRVLDLFRDRITTRSPPSKRAEDVKAYVVELDAAWASAKVDPTCMVVASDTAVPRDPTAQAVVCALVFVAGEEVHQIRLAAGLRSASETECFALQLGISVAVAAGCQRLVVFSDLAPAMEIVFDTRICSGQVFSLNACKSVRPWFSRDDGCWILLMQVPSRLEWGMQKEAHDTAKAVPRISVGPRLRTSIDFLLAKADRLAEKDWHRLWQQSSYRGQSVYPIEESRGKPLLPSTRKGGPWLKYVGYDSALTVHSNRVLCSHAPIGEYRRRFHLAGDIYCRCAHRPVQTQDHLLRVFPGMTRKEHRRVFPGMTCKEHRCAPSDWEEWVLMLKVNSLLGAFPPTLPLVEEEGWGPG